MSYRCDTTRDNHLENLFGIRCINWYRYLEYSSTCDRRKEKSLEKECYQRKITNLVWDNLDTRRKKLKAKFMFKLKINKQTPEHLMQSVFKSLSTSYGLEGQRKQISSASTVSAAVGHCYK